MSWELVEQAIRVVIGVFGIILIVIGLVSAYHEIEDLIWGCIKTGRFTGYSSTGGEAVGVIIITLMIAALGAAIMYFAFGFLVPLP